MSSPKNSYTTHSPLNAAEIYTRVREENMKYFVLWLLGVPAGVLVVIWLVAQLF